MTRSINDLGETFLAQLNEIATGGDKTVEKSPDDFIAWCQPGIPFDEADFDFAVKGIGGGKDAEEDKLLIQQAFNFSQAVDFVPDVTGIYKEDKQQAVFRTSQARLSHMYGEILRLCRVVSTELTDKEKEKLDKFRKLMFETKKQTNPVTDEETEVTVPGKVLRAYNEVMAKYVDEALVYNQARIAAQGATGPEGKTAVANWTNNESLLRMKVKAAKDSWVSGGFKNEVDQMNAFINQTTQRDMVLWKQRFGATPTRGPSCQDWVPVSNSSLRQSFPGGLPVRKGGPTIRSTTTKSHLFKRSRASPGKRAVSSDGAYGARAVVAARRRPNRVRNSPFQISRWSLSLLSCRSVSAWHVPGVLHESRLDARQGARMAV